MKIVSIINHKGGVGKTMTTLNLGAALALKKKRVLLVDFDPQCNLTDHCGITPDSETKTISDYLYDDELPIVPIELSKNLHLLPSAETLDQDSINMGAMEDTKAAIVLLKEILDRVGEGYDYILIDCAPGSGMLMLNSVAASNEMIIPIWGKDSLKGVTKISNIMKANNFSIKARYLLTIYDNRLSVDREIKDYLISSCPELVFHTIIRRNAALDQAACNNMNVFQYAPKSNGALDYMSLAQEISGTRRKNLIL